MIQIDEPYVDSAAPNSSAIKNGRGLVVKGKFFKLNKSEDESIIFGECTGVESRITVARATSFTQPTPRIAVVALAGSSLASIASG